MNHRYTRVSTYYTWVQNQICSQSSCRPNTCPCECFSGDTTVQVLQKVNKTITPSPHEEIFMKDLQVGDQIYTGQITSKGQPKYQTVYAFGHYKHNQMGHFLQIHTTNNNNSNNKNNTSSPLEITSNHLLYVKGQKDPIPAQHVKVGDYLVTSSGNQQRETSQAVMVTQIKHIEKEGVYMPLTTDGKIVVNGGLQVSVYTSIMDYAPTVVQRAISQMGISEHLLSHMWMTPYRIMCLGISSHLCTSSNSSHPPPPTISTRNEREGSGWYNDEGILYYLYAGKILAEWVDPINSFIQMWIFMPPILLVYGSLYLVEVVVGPSIAPTALLILGVILIRIVISVVIDKTRNKKGIKLSVIHQQKQDQSTPKMKVQ